jgi:type IV secretory pathway VirB10-like protein
METEKSDDFMSPAESPGQQSRGSGVRRVNNLPVYIVGGGLSAFLLIMVLVASDRAAKQAQSGQQPEGHKGGNTSVFAKEIAGELKDGIIRERLPAAPAVTGAVAAPVPLEIASTSNLDLPPAPPRIMVPPTSEQQVQLQPIHSARDDEADRVRIMKLQQFDEAVKAKTSLPVTMPRSVGANQRTGAATSKSASADRDEVLASIAAVRQQLDADTRDDPTRAYKARLQQIRGVADDHEQAATGNRSMLPGAGIVRSESSDDRWRLNSRTEPPRTPYELRAGFVVPATLISGVNSELPGQVIAQVSQDVFDTPLGKYRLIPQGARLVGSYSSEAAYGQSRIFVAWQRIIFPDGKALDIGSMPGADSAGHAGFKDQLNNHYLRLFSSALLMSSVTAGIALSQPQATNVNARQTAGSAMSEALGQQLGQVTAQLIAKNLNVAPTLEIRPGYRFNVVVVKDMTFSKPYAAFDY